MAARAATGSHETQAPLRRDRLACPGVATAILDVRNACRFEAGHLRGAYSWPWSDKDNRGFELPPRSTAVTVVCDDDNDKEGDAGGNADISGDTVCVRRGCGGAEGCGLRCGAARQGAAATETWFVQWRNHSLARRGGYEWPVAVALPFRQAIAAAAAAAAAAASTEGAAAAELARGPSAPGVFLFGASPLLAQSRARLEATAAAAAARGRRPRALDVGCGSGRDAILLASWGWDVTALDCDKKALKRWLALAARQGYDTGEGAGGSSSEGGVRCRALRVKTSVRGDLVRALREGSGDGDSGTAIAADDDPSFDLVLLCRHLHRPTLREMGRELLAPGGLLLVHTFMVGNDRPTDARLVLEQGELARMFGGAAAEARAAGAGAAGVAAAAGGARGAAGAQALGEELDALNLNTGDRAVAGSRLVSLRRGNVAKYPLGRRVANMGNGGAVRGIVCAVSADDNSQPPAGAGSITVSMDELAGSTTEEEVAEEAPLLILRDDVCEIDDGRMLSFFVAQNPTE